MATFAFVMLHLVVLMLAPMLLAITLPLHFIYSAIAARPRVSESAPKRSQVSHATHVRCPECAEVVLRQARKCKHCGSSISPR